jgi:hypothetical protein
MEPASGMEPEKALNPKRKFKMSIATAISIAAGIFIGNLATQYFFNSNNVRPTAQQLVQKTADYFNSTSSWKEFNSAVGNFKVIFPTYPRHETKVVSIPNTNLTLTYDTYTSQEPNQTTYFINTSVYPSSVDTSRPENNLEGSLNGMVAVTDGNKLVSSNISDFNGYKSLNFLIQNNNTYLKGRVILVRHTMYQQMVAYESQNYDDSNYNKFINSFTLIGS